MDTEEDTDFVTSEEMNLDPDDLVISSTSSNTEFCMVYDDDVMEDSPPDRDASVSKVESDVLGGSADTKKNSSGVDLDIVEAIKKKTDEIASSLKRFRSSRGKSANTSTTSENYEPPEEFKRYHETTQLVAQKLKEDRLLFEESQKRSETSRSSKRFHKDSSKPSAEEPENLSEINDLKHKVDRLESTISRLQDALDEKDQIISEKEETIRNLSESVSNEYATRLNLLEQSEEEIRRIKEEHTKTIERITASKEEFCNQLQVIRQKYLQVENELKLADFARCRLVNKNAQLTEKITQLQHENEELKKTFSQEEKDEEEKENQSPTPLPDTKDYVSKHQLHPKIECLEMIINEFHAYLAESDISNNEFADDEYAIKTLEKISDKLESMFYLTKDKLTIVTQLEENLAQNREKISHLERLNDDHKQQGIKLKKLLASLKSKVQSESAACKDLSDQLAKSKDRVNQLEQQLSSKAPDETDDWKQKYLELEKVNQHISLQLNEMRKKLLSGDSMYQGEKPSDEISALKSECARLREENNEISMLLEMKNREHDVLMVECESLRKAQEDCSSSDKTENDFVVLQKRDAECDDHKSEDSLKEKYQKLCEDNDKLMTSIRSMSEKAIEWENEKLTMRNYRDLNERLKNEYEELNEHLQSARYRIEELVLQKGKAEKEIETLNSKLDALESQLISNEELLQEQSSNTMKLNEQLRLARELNDKLKSELELVQRKLASGESDDRNSTIEELKSTVDSLEAEKSKLFEECEKFKTKYQRLQVYCKANINKGDKSSDVEGEKYRNKCKELLALNKKLQDTLNEVQLAKQKDEEDVEKLNAENQSLQTYCTQVKQQIETLKVQNVELLELKASYEELQASNTRLKEALLEAQRNTTIMDELEAAQKANEELKRALQQAQQDTAPMDELEDLRNANEELKRALHEAEQNSSLVDELRSLQKANEELHQRYLSTAQQVDKLSRENAELREHATVIEDNRLQRANYEDEMARQRRDNHTLNDQLAEALRQIDRLSNDNADLTARLQQHIHSKEMARELEWYRREYESLKTYCDEISQRLDTLEGENAQLKRTKVTFDEQFAHMAQEAGQLRQMLDQMKTENQALDATNEQLMDFCNKAREKIAALNQNDQDYSLEVETLRSKCADLEASNRRLLDQLADADEMDRLRSENDMLIATNEQLTEFCTNAKHKMDELERVKNMSDDLQQTIDKLRETYEVELAELKNQLAESGLPNNARLALESELALAKEKIADYEEQLSRTDDIIAQLQGELSATKAELKRFRDHVDGVQQEATALVQKCTSEIERLNTTVVQLSDQNAQLTERCHMYDDYVIFYQQTYPLIERFRGITDEAYDIVDKLEHQLGQDARKSNASVQCEQHLLDCYVREKYVELKEERLHVSTLKLISDRLTELEKYADTVEQELVEKERILVHYKTTLEEERKRYENLIDDLRQSGSMEKSHQPESQPQHDLERYKALITEERSKYENIIGEMQQNLQHYKSLVDQERAKYERIIFEMQENTNQLNASRQDYENVIFDYRQKLDDCLTMLREKEMKNEPSTRDIASQYDTTKMDSRDDSDSSRMSEVKLLDAFKPVESVQEKLPMMKKYYDYCKDAITREIKDILKPEDEVVGDWATDVEVENEMGETRSVGSLIEALDEVVKRFSISSFAHDYKFDETIEEFPLAFKLAELFQVVVSYYVDSPNSRENPYALELLKKFRDVAEQIDQTQPVQPVVGDIQEERFDELLITAQRFERENKYLLEAVSFFEDLFTEYSSFDSELRLCDLIHRWRENLVFDSAVPYYEFKVTIDEVRVFPPKSMNEFNEAFHQWKSANVKRIDIIGVRGEIREADRPAEVILLDVYKILETVKGKMHELICDLHYVYSSENRQVNPVEFFEQIEDINHWVEQSLKTILNDESIRQDVSNIMADSEAEHHSHDEYDESQSDATSDEKHSHTHHDDERDTVAELKAMLGASNKKIDSLVKELTEVKNSREYNEFRQLHSKLDETMYQLHLRDVHCVELTQELTQLLSERDSLQLKLSTILRQNEQLREASQSTSTYDDISKEPSNLENKLKDLQQVNYMKDPLISEASRLHHTSQMHLFSDDGAESQRNKESKDSGGFSVPSLFKWITGDTEDK